MHTLNLYNTESIDRLAWPEDPEALRLNSPATDVFTDFEYHLPHVVEESVPASKIERIMQQSHVHMMLVVNHSGVFTGIVADTDVNSQKIMQKVAQGMERKALKVSDFMQRRESLKAFDFCEIHRATIGDIVETLKDNHQRHCLVLDRKGHKIRGVISVSDIARILKLPLTQAPSFYNLSSVIAA